jgi:hypothetical protein
MRPAMPADSSDTITTILERLDIIEAAVGISHNGGPPLDEGPPANLLKLIVGCRPRRLLSAMALFCGRSVVGLITPSWGFRSRRS